MPPPTIAVVAYTGVTAAEADAFSAVFGAVPGWRVITVGAELGVVAGGGGVQLVGATFDEVEPDVIAVPGGMGSHRHTEIAAWIDRVEPRFVLASSTGATLLAAGGLLRGRRVATHWLAGPVVTAYGAEVVDERVVVDDPFITCQGALSAVDAAFYVVRALGGDGLVRVTRAALAASAVQPVTCLRTRRRWRRRRRVTTVEPDPWPPADVELDEHRTTDP